eukprot:1842426-Prymnesium_polylepis.1
MSLAPPFLVLHVLPSQYPFSGAASPGNAEWGTWTILPTLTPPFARLHRSPPATTKQCGA